MAVAEVLTLPNQPTVGAVVLRPLGGDGYSSPMSAYLVRLFSVTADASGGTATLTINTDPQYESVFNFLNVAVASAAANEPVRFDFFERGAIAAGVAKWEIFGSTFFNSDVGAGCAVSPPPMFDIGRVSVATDNIDTETVRLNCIIYNFRRDAAQRTPLAVLLASLPRGFNITGPFV